jgi:hypothetical protein
MSSESQARYRKTVKGRAQVLYDSAKARAKKKGLEFTLVRDDVLSGLQTGQCAATGALFNFNAGSAFAPTLDRRDPARGYTPDNIEVVCAFWNFLKGDFTEDDLGQIVKLLRHSPRFR